MIPKFRAWDTFKKNWVKHFYITENGLIYNMEQQHRDLIGAVPIEKSGLILMQSTGLFDKNGVEIFEGDVVTGLDYDLMREVGEVKFFDACFVVVGPAIGLPLSGFDDIQIIGNIHEHPHLVEGSG